MRKSWVSVGSVGSLKSRRSSNIFRGFNSCTSGPGNFANESPSANASEGQLLEASVSVSQLRCGKMGQFRPWRFSPSAVLLMSTGYGHFSPISKS
eukprot:s28_g37.t1